MHKEDQLQVEATVNGQSITTEMVAGTVYNQ